MTQKRAFLEILTELQTILNAVSSATEQSA